MKKPLAILLAVPMLISLAACSNAGGNASKATESSKAETTKAPDTTEAAQETVPQSVSNTTYNVGEFTVFVPEGWTAIPVPDHTDSSKTATNDIQLAKGTVYSEEEKKWKTDDCPNFYITYLGKEDFAKVPSQKEYDAKDFSVKDMEDKKIGSLTWQGYSVNPIGADVYIMWAASGDGGYYTSISTAYGLKIEDDDVQKILGSLK